MKQDLLNDYLLTAIKASIDAGKAILDVYNSDHFEVELKSDQSPLTKADKEAHQVISNYLKQYDIPVLSEEGKSLNYEERKDWDLLWCVDPLDGTKEFIKRNGEFTVNIALISGQSPVAGTIYVPVTGELYFGAQSLGAFKVEIRSGQIPDDLHQLIEMAWMLPIQEERKEFVAVGSRSHMSAETEAYFNQLRAIHGEVKIISRGSALKLCMVAEGKADVYPRFAPTMEWDTAAGHAILRAMNAEVYQQDEKNPLVYNKPDLVNPWFIVKSGNHGE